MRLKRLILSLLFFLFLNQAVRAQTPPAAVIRVEPNEPVFLETDLWYPGLSLRREVEIYNDDNQDRWLGIRGENLSPGGDLAAVIYLSITNQEGVCLYGCGSDLKSLRQFNQTEVVLNELVPAHDSRRLTITATMDPQAGNEYQGLTEKIDFVFGFLPLPTPTATVTPSPNPTATSTTTTTTGGTVCSASAPGAPLNLLAVPAGPGQVLLSWQPPTEGKPTHYSILYGLSPGDYLYGNHNVGLTTNYLVSGLTPATTYYFVVLAVNDCAPGPYSQEVSAVAGRGLAAVAPGPAPGFEILGEATQPGQIAGGTATQAGSVAGANISGFQFSWWWILIILVGIMLLWWLRWRKRD